MTWPFYYFVTHLQVLTERNKLTVRTKKVIDTMLSNAVKETLMPETEFWTSSKTLLTLAEGDYFKNNDNVAYPEKLKTFLGSGQYYKSPFYY